MNDKLKTPGRALRVPVFWSGARLRAEGLWLILDDEPRQGWPQRHPVALSWALVDRIAEAGATRPGGHRTPPVPDWRADRAAMTLVTAVLLSLLLLLGWAAYKAGVRFHAELRRGGVAITCCER